ARAAAAGTPEEQAGVLAQHANAQMAVYRAHFAGRSRLGRRPGLLSRLIDGLRAHARMTALRTGGLKAEFNDRNLGIVEENLRTYEGELRAIRQLRGETGLA